MSKSPSPTRIVRIGDVRRELADWRTMYASEVATHAACAGELSPSAAAWLALRVDGARRGSALDAACDDVLVLVLGFLSYHDLVLGAGSACRRLRFLTQHPRLWNRFSLSSLLLTSGLPVQCRYSTDASPRSFTRAEVESFWIRQLVEHRFAPRHLDLQTARISQRALRQVIASVKTVTTLDLSYVESLCDADLASIASISPTKCCKPPRVLLGVSLSPPPPSAALTGLRIAFCCGFTGEALLNMLAVVPTLQSLDVSGCEQLTGADLGGVLACAPQLIAFQCNSTAADETTFARLPVAAAPLRRLHCAFTRVDDNTVCTIGERCAHLEELGLSCCPGVSDSALRRFVLAQQAGATPRTNLRALHIDGCVALTDASVAPLIAASPRLRRIHLDRCRIGAATLEAALCLAELEYLSVASCLHLMRDLPRHGELRRALSERRWVLSPSSRSIAR